MKMIKVNVITDIRVNITYRWDDSHMYIKCIVLPVCDGVFLMLVRLLVLNINFFINTLV
jgi:hypothetical protein